MMGGVTIFKKLQIWVKISLKMNKKSYKLIINQFEHGGQNL